MFGSHLSMAGSMHKALLAAEGYGTETVQVFTKNYHAERLCTGILSRLPFEPRDCHEFHESSDFR
jgi:hypothetical protein